MCDDAERVAQQVQQKYWKCLQDKSAVSADDYLETLDLSKLNLGETPEKEEQEEEEAAVAEKKE